MHPSLFRLGPIEIYSYGVMLMAAFIAAILWAGREAKRRGLQPSQIIDLSLWILLLGLLLARLFFILLNLEYYLSQPLSSLFFWQGRLGIQGLSFHGGLAGAILGLLLYSRRAKIPWLTLADICAPAAALGYGIGRLGCFLNGCCYGSPTDLPWGVRFLISPQSSLLTPPSHPTQIYSALASWAIFALLLWLRDRLRAPGQLFFAYLGLYSGARFLIEFLRRSFSAEIAVDSLTYAQVASMLILALSILLFARLQAKTISALKQAVNTSQRLPRRGNENAQMDRN